MRRIALAALAALTLAGGAAAKGPQPLFASNDVIHLTIKGAINTLGASGDKTVPGTLTVAGGEALPITLAARGITRRARDVCQFPPLRVEFPDKPPAGSLFKGQKKLKLVTHCRGAASFQQYVLLEYAAYRMYNLLTPVSFSARLASIDYVDDKGKPIASRLGFFLEDIDDVAKRNDLTKLKLTDHLPVARLRPADAARFTVFEYLIGNLDWAMTAGPPGTDCCHNSRLLVADPAGPVTPVPYDFDFAGMVDAPYATPPAAIPLPNVRVRRFRGYCSHGGEAQAAAASIAARRAELLGVLDAVPQLGEDAKRKAAGYLGGGFDQLGNPAALTKLMGTCIG